MWDWTSFFAGMALDSLVLTVVLVVLGPWMIERWIYSRAFDVFEDFMADKRMNDLIQNYVVKRLWGNAGGRPPSIAGAIKGGIAQVIFQGISGFAAKMGAPAGPPGAQQAAETAGEVFPP